MSITKTTPAPPRLPPLRIGLECGLVTLSVFDGATWCMLPCTSLRLALRFMAVFGYEAPADVVARIAAGAIVELAVKP